MTDHGTPPKCKYEPCTNLVEWNKGYSKWKRYCCDEHAKLQKIVTAKKSSAMWAGKRVDHGEPPKCFRRECPNLVRWRDGNWNSYCSSICAGKDIMPTKRKRIILPSEAFEADERDVIPDSWLSPLE